MAVVAVVAVRPPEAQAELAVAVQVVQEVQRRPVLRVRRDWAVAVAVAALGEAVPLLHLTAELVERE